MPERVFLSRPDFTRRFGLMCASQLSTWRSRGWPLPPSTKVAVMIDGVVYEAQPGESLHCQVGRREGVMGQDCVDGFTFDSFTGQPVGVR